MQDQVYIGDSGELESQPLTWDGEPLFSPDTVREGLFDRSAFEQLPGQTALDVDNAPEVVKARREMFRGFGWSVSA